MDPLRRGISEDLGTPRSPVGREQRVRPGDRPGDELLDTARARELAEGEAAEVDGAELAGVEPQLRLRLRALAARRPAALVPRTERVRDLEDDLAVARERPRRERGADVDEPHPEPVPQLVVQPPRLREQEEQRMV